MSRKFDSPVQTKMAVPVLKNPLITGEYPGPKPTGIRRVFVQNETASVLGMDLDRRENAHVLNRRLQIDESSLTFGDTVLKNDSPVLSTRNLLHRSSSTPCLSPAIRDIQQRNQIGPIEILGNSNCIAITKKLVKEIVKAVKNGIEPRPVHSGLGGAYYFQNICGESVAIVKPADEEPFAPNNPKGFVGKGLGQPGLKRSVRVGETCYREVAAYLLDLDHFANVPPTALVKITHSIFNVNGIMTQNKDPRSKIASLQKYIPHDFDASDYGTSSFPVTAVHRIGILDIRILNTDRHAGNLLVRKLDGLGKFGQVDLIPIDHGLCLPESLEDPYFEWIHWPQSSIPFSDDELQYIANLDPSHDSEMLRSELPMIRDASFRVLFLCTTFLKEAASYGLCLAEIGEMMSREFRSSDEKPSELEILCIEARRLIAQEMLFFKHGSDIDEFQFDIDCENNDPFHHHFFTGSRNRLFKLEEEDENESGSESESEFEDESLKGLTVYDEAEPKNPIFSKLSMSLQNTSLGEMKYKQLEFAGTGTDSGHRSANDPLPASMTFVKFTDMKEDEWELFLDKFVDILSPAFAKRKEATACLKQRQRLGTSCKF